MPFFLSLKIENFVLDYLYVRNFIGCVDSFSKITCRLFVVNVMKKITVNFVGLL